MYRTSYRAGPEPDCPYLHGRAKRLILITPYKRAPVVASKARAFMTMFTTASRSSPTYAKKAKFLVHFLN